MDQKVIDQLKEEHDEVYILTADEHEVVVRPPTDKEFERFAASSANDAKLLSAMNTLVLDVTLHPSREEMKALFKRRPGLGASLGKQVVKLAGANLEVEVKKG